MPIPSDIDLDSYMFAFETLMTSPILSKHLNGGSTSIVKYLHKSTCSSRRDIYTLIRCFDGKRATILDKNTSLKMLPVDSNASTAYVVLRLYQYGLVVDQPSFLMRLLTFHNLAACVERPDFFVMRPR